MKKLSSDRYLLKVDLVGGVICSTITDTNTNAVRSFKQVFGTVEGVKKTPELNNRFSDGRRVLP